MKTKIIVLFAAAVSVWSAGAQGHRPVAQPVAEGRELPRTQTISYNSEERAVAAGREASQYFQPLTDWRREQLADGNVRYSTTFKIPFAWFDRQNFVYIGGVGSSYEVEVNGQVVGSNHSGRSAAEFDISEAAKEGMNNLSVTVHAASAAAALSPCETTITGETYVVSQPKVRIRDFVATANLAGDKSSLELGVIVKTSLLNPKTVRVYYALTAPDGTAGPYGHRDTEIEMRGEDTVRFFVPLDNAKPWSHEIPNLYTLSLKLQHEGRYTEYISYKIGLRTVEMRDGSMLVNGHDVPLYVAEYRAEGGREAVAAALARFKADGINTIKVVGGPQPDYFYSECDRLGLYVCAQADIDTRASGDSRRVGGNPSNDPRWEEAYKDRVMTMYHTAQNHPSAVMFSLADNSSNGYNLYESYLALKSVECARPVVYLGADGEWNTDAVSAGVAAAMPTAVGSRFVLDTTPRTDEARKAGYDVSPVDPSGGVFRLANNFFSEEMRAASLDYVVMQGRKVRSKGTLDVNVAPHGSTQVTIPYGKAKRGARLTVEITVRHRPQQNSGTTALADKNFSFQVTY